MSNKASKLGSEETRAKLDVKKLVLHESAYKCANPRCRHPLTLEIHHLLYVSEGGGSSADNLLPLCPNCHSEHHKSIIPTESLRAWKMLLITLNEAYDRRAIDLLLLVDRLGRVARISGDGIVDYAPLVASNLVEIAETEPVEGMMQPFREMQRMYIASATERGHLFVEAWKKGDQRAAIASLPAVGQED